MPEIVRLYIQSVFAGFALAGSFVGLLVWQDIGGIGQLMHGSSDGPLALVVLVVLHGLVFSGAQFALSIMALAEDDAPRGGRGRLVRVRVAAERSPQSTSRRG